MGKITQSAQSVKDASGTAAEGEELGNVYSNDQSLEHDKIAHDFRNCLTNSRNMFAIFPTSSKLEQLDGVYQVKVINQVDNSDLHDDASDLHVSIADACSDPNVERQVRDIASRLNKVLKMLNERKPK